MDMKFNNNQVLIDNGFFVLKIMINNQNKYLFNFNLYSHTFSGFTKTGNEKFTQLTYSNVYGRGYIDKCNSTIGLDSFHDDNIKYNLIKYPKFMNILCNMFRFFEKSNIYYKKYIKPDKKQYQKLNNNLPFN